jgi:hypothetical protein
MMWRDIPASLKTHIIGVGSGTHGDSTKVKFEMSNAMQPSRCSRVIQPMPGALHQGITGSREYQSSQTPHFAGHAILVRTPVFAGDRPARGS